MPCFLKRTWARVDLDKITYNYRSIRAFLHPGCKIMAVVKADAYGHGVEYVAPALDAAGADSFAVSNIEEALQLRRAGIRKPVLILGFTPAEYAGELIEQGLAQTVHTEEYARALSDRAVKEGGRVAVHIKIDTGMGRIGFVCTAEGPNDESIGAVERAARLPGLIPEGIFTHFSVADEPGQNDYTRRQFAAFTGAVEALHRRGVDFDLRHCCNSAGLMYFPEMQMDMVRPGIILYGLRPDASLETPIDLKPAMELKTVVSQVKSLPAGCTVSYGRTYTTAGETAVVTLPVGYADGFSRRLSNSAEVLINGRRAKIIGRVCMDQCMAEVPGGGLPQPGSEVTIVGRDGKEEITMDEVAAKMGTINYEVTCLIGKRVPRVFYQDGKSTGVVNLILP